MQNLQKERASKLRVERSLLAWAGLLVLGSMACASTPSTSDPCLDICRATAEGSAFSACVDRCLPALPQPEPEPEPEPVPEPVMGRTLNGVELLVTDAGWAVVPDPDRGALWVVQISRPEASPRRVNLEPDDEPFRLVEDATGLVHVTLAGGGAVVRLDPATGEIERRAICPAPRGIAYEVRAHRLHVACAGGELIRLRPADGEVEQRVVLDPDLRDVVVRDGRRFVSRYRAAEVLEIDEEGALVGRIAPAEFRASPLAPRYAARGAERLRIGPAGDLLLLHRWARVDPILLDAGFRGDAVQLPQLSGCLSPLLGGLTRLRPGFGDAGHQAFQWRNWLDMDTNGSDVTLSISHWDFGPHPAPQLEERRCLDLEFDLSFGTRVWDRRGSSLGGSTIEWAANPPALRINQRQYDIVVPAEPILTEGRDRFDAPGASGLSCASCHSAGGDDGHTWDIFPTGPRRTLGLAGGLSERRVFLRGGEHPDLDWLMFEKANLIGAVFPRETREALIAWLDALPPPPAAAVSVERAAAGADVFEAAGCGDCHRGDLGTDGLRHDVGTGGEWVTASLLGLAVRAPYLHDGRAATLDEVLTVELAPDDPELDEPLAPHEIGHLDPEARALLFDYLRAR